MAKQSGLGDQLFIGGYDLSGDVGSVQALRSSCNLLVVTAINKSAIERLNGQRDGLVSFNTWYDNAALAEHPALKGRPTTDTQVAYYHGSAIGNMSANMVAKQINYNGARGNTGELQFSVEAHANGYGLEFGEQLTVGKRTDVAATNGASLDFGAVSSLFGMSAYLQVFAFTGTDVTVKLQDSADNSSFSDVTAGAFTQTTAAQTHQRIETGLAATIRRYVRVATVTSGGVTSVTFAVSFVRYLGARDP